MQAIKEEMKDGWKEKEKAEREPHEQPTASSSSPHRTQRNPQRPPLIRVPTDKIRSADRRRQAFNQSDPMRQGSGVCNRSADADSDLWMGLFLIAMD